MPTRTRDSQLLDTDGVNTGPATPAERLHEAQLRWRVEELLRRRRPDEERRYAMAQRRGRIDPNPHQVDAVMFAMRRIKDGGGCILADEVGLGKTIEAGLVMAQLLAEGAERILLVLPAALIGQWQNELLELFAIETREDGGPDGLFGGPGVYVVSRDFAGSERGSGVLRSAPAFDLCVIDEAHEVFAGIYRRFDRDGLYQEDSRQATTAHQVRSFLKGTPVLLLTATPIQNNLTELWGLAQYVEPTGTLLGTLPTFKELFCEDSAGKGVIPEQAGELRERINRICQRTLRRQAQEFLKRRFTRRQARLFRYAMSPEERALYDDVTDYLLEPDLCAFRGSQRQLLLVGFHRRMGSSMPALAASLRKVAERLERMQDGDPRQFDATAEAFAEDLEEPQWTLVPAGGPAPPEPSRIQAEHARVQGFIARAEAIPRDTKAEQFLKAVKVILERGRDGRGSGKAVVFTESLTTQDYLVRILGELGLTPDDITLFRGVNEGPRVEAAYARWQQATARAYAKARRPSRKVAVRLALVHEFRERSAIFISTEAGAKGLNLQFCDTIINYDLPWNPQRIEQRIGRCHRYSQERDVTVFNFLSHDNEAEELTYEILSRKLELFGQVMDASDVVLHEPQAEAPAALVSAIGMDFEEQVRQIYERARSRGEICDELRRLSDQIDRDRERFARVQERMAGLIDSRLDESVRTVFRRLAAEIPQALRAFDAELESIVADYLSWKGYPFERTADSGRTLFAFPAGSPVEEVAGPAVSFGEPTPEVAAMHPGHPLFLHLAEDIRAATRDPCWVAIGAQDLPSGLRGRRGVFRLYRVAYQGFDPEDRLVPVAIAAGSEGHPLDEPAVSALLRSRLVPAPCFDPGVSDDSLRDALDDRLFADQEAVEVREQGRYDAMMRQIERFLEDRILLLQRRLRKAEEALAEAHLRRERAPGAQARALEADKANRLEAAVEALEKQIDDLLNRRDPDFQKWRQSLHERRYRPPAVALLMQVNWRTDEPQGGI